LISRYTMLAAEPVSSKSISTLTAASLLCLCRGRLEA
jgi:hypothetical protein